MFMPVSLIILCIALIVIMLFFLVISIKKKKILGIILSTLCLLLFTTFFVIGVTPRLVLVRGQIEIVYADGTTAIWDDVTFPRKVLGQTKIEEDENGNPIQMTFQKSPKQ